MKNVCIIAESKLYARVPQKRLRNATVRIHAPLPSGQDYKCQVQLKGIDRPRQVYGIDGLQALLLATQFLRQRITELVKEGWRFYLEKDDEEPVDLKFIWFSQVPRKFKRR